MSARGVARLYQGLIDGYVLDERDRAEARDIEKLGLATRVVDTIMRDAKTAARLAEAVLELAGPPR